MSKTSYVSTFFTIGKKCKVAYNKLNKNKGGRDGK